MSLISKKTNCFNCTSGEMGPPEVKNSHKMDPSIVSKCTSCSAYTTLFMNGLKFYATNEGSWPFGGSRD